MKIIFKYNFVWSGNKDSTKCSAGSDNDGNANDQVWRWPTVWWRGDNNWHWRWWGQQSRQPIAAMFNNNEEQWQRRMTAAMTNDSGNEDSTNGRQQRRRHWQLLKVMMMRATSNYIIFSFLFYIDCITMLLMLGCCGIVSSWWNTENKFVCRSKRPSTR